MAKQRPSRRRRRRRVEDLLKDWLKSDDVTSLGAKTQSGYARQVEAVIWQPVKRGAEKIAKEAFSQAPVAAIEPPEVKAFYEYAKKARGWHMALAMIAVIRAAYSWGRTSTAWRIKQNPALKLELKRPKGRVVIFTDAELRHAGRRRRRQRPRLDRRRRHARPLHRAAPGRPPGARGRRPGRRAPKVPPGQDRRHRRDPARRRRCASGSRAARVAASRSS
jgi:hypothetical protein